MEKSTIICRCEEINVEEIESAMQQGAQTFDDIKRLTRCGMGPCQGKTCHSLAASLIATVLDKPVAEMTLPRLRIPLKPVPIRVLAGNETGEGSKVKSLLAEADLNEGQET